MEGAGETERRSIMYHYVQDKAFLSHMRTRCGQILQDTCHLLKERFDISASFYLVGSGARNLITQNADQPIDLDYNLQIVRCEDFYDGRRLKECVRIAFNQAFCSHGQRDCSDSRSALTSKLLDFYAIDLKGRTLPRCSIDLCIVMERAGRTYRLIHKKTGWSADDEYYWNEAPSSKVVRRKAEYIKKHGMWHLVRAQYLDIKNMYLSRNDKNHPSFLCYAEAVHQVYHIKNPR